MHVYVAKMDKTPQMHKNLTILVDLQSTFDISCDIPIIGKIGKCIPSCRFIHRDTNGRVTVMMRARNVMNKWGVSILAALIWWITR